MKETSDKFSFADRIRLVQEHILEMFFAARIEGRATAEEPLMLNDVALSTAIHPKGVVYPFSEDDGFAQLHETIEAFNAAVFNVESALRDLDYHPPAGRGTIISFSYEITSGYC